MDEVYDVIVIGLGGHGSSACYHLASKGNKVLGIEQYGRVHKLGSSHGYSRLIRKAYYEDPSYVPLMERAFQLWDDLKQYESENHESIYENPITECLINLVGGLMIGNRDSDVVKGTLLSVKKHNLSNKILSNDEVLSKYPEFVLQPDEIAVFEEEAGYLIPEQCIQSYSHRAESNGAKLNYNETMLSWKIKKIDEKSLVEIETSKGKYYSYQLVLSVGAWASNIYGNEINLPIKIERRTLHWFNPTIQPNRFSDSPVFIWDLNDGANFYGFPSQHGNISVKVAYHEQLDAFTEYIDHPSNINREVTDNDISLVRQVMSTRIPNLANGDVEKSVTCMYTSTNDRHFLLDWHPAYSNVLLVSPCSGHGFKFCSVIGEIISDLISTRHTDYDISLFSLQNRMS